MATLVVSPVLLHDWLIDGLIAIFHGAILCAAGVDSLRGTLPWMAPELLRYPNAITEACDIYSFGVVMWELWTGQEPFEGMQLHALLHQLTGSNRLKLPIPGEDSWREHYLASITSSCNLDALDGEGREEEEAGALGPSEPVVGYKELMLRCWREAPDERPNTSQLLEALEVMMGVLRQMQRSRSAASRSSSTGPGSSGSGGR